MIKLIASDLDGTIIGENNQICKNNIEAMNALKDTDLNFTICTGKTYSILKNTCSQFNANYGIFGNGNQIVNLQTGEEIYKNLLVPSDISRCMKIAKEHHLHVHVYTANEVITEKLLYLDLRNYTLKQNHFYDMDLEFKIVENIEDYLKTHELEVYKLIISSTDSLNPIKSEILANADLTVCRIGKYGDYKDSIINKEYEYLDITPSNINKEHALSILRDHLNLNKEEVLAIGDNMNDLDMIAHSGIGVAMANAYDEVKQVANYTTNQSVDNGGFAEAVYKFIEF